MKYPQGQKFQCKKGNYVTVVEDFCVDKALLSRQAHNIKRLKLIH